MNGTVQNAQVGSLSALLGQGLKHGLTQTVEFDSLRRPRFSTHSCDSKRESNSASPQDFAFTSQNGNPLDQEGLNDFVWKPTRRRAGIAQRGQYCIRDTFISLPLSSGEDPGRVAQVCGTSEETILRHYRGGLRDCRLEREEGIAALLHPARASKSWRTVSQTVSSENARIETRIRWSVAERGDSKIPTK